MENISSYYAHLCGGLSTIVRATAFDLHEKGIISGEQREKIQAYLEAEMKSAEERAKEYVSE